MLLTITRFEELNTRALMDLYREGNLENTEYFYPGMDRERALELVERGFLDFLRTDFFNGVNRYYILESECRWVSALRLNRVREGFWYLEALETHPDFRRRGYATRLLGDVLEDLKREGPFTVCDCVHKENGPSVATHRRAGFVIAGDGVDYLRGTTDEEEYGMRYDYR